MPKTLAALFPTERQSAAALRDLESAGIEAIVVGPESEFLKFIPDDDRALYAEALKRGRSLLIANATDADAERAADLIEAHEPEAPDHVEAPPESEPTRFDRRAPAGPGIETRIVDEPVEREVETESVAVTCESRPAAREPSSGEQAFEPFEMTLADTEEELVISKKARVVEEVVVTRTRSARRQTIREVLRRTEVSLPEQTL